MGILIQNFKVVEDIEKLPESIFFKWVKMWTDILILVILFTTNQICSQPVEHKNDTNPDLGNNVKEAERVQSQITNSSLDLSKASNNISKTAKHLNFPIENETNTNEENASNKKGAINVKEENASGATQVTSMNLEKNSQSQNSANKNQTDDTFLVKGENGKSVLRQNQTDQDNLKLQENPKEAAEDNTAKETKPGSLDPEGVNKTLSTKSDVNDVKPTATEKKSKVVQLKQNFQKTM